MPSDCLHVIRLKQLCLPAENSLDLPIVESCITTDDKQ
jgi:hypothetical protein